jgi:hypothetical protein
MLAPNVTPTEFVTVIRIRLIDPRPVVRPLSLRGLTAREASRR